MAALFGWSPVSTLIVVAIVLFFIIAIANKWINMAIPFNKWIAWPACLVPFFIIGKIWSVRNGLVIGLVCGLAAGIFAGYTMGTTESGD